MRGQTRLIREQLEEAEQLRIAGEGGARGEERIAGQRADAAEASCWPLRTSCATRATHDVLTGVWNRGALLDLLRSEMERCLRTHSTVGVLMLDVDHFKPVNDTHGIWWGTKY